MQNIFVVSCICLYVFVFSAASELQVISSRDDLLVDTHKHLKQSYLLYTNSPICVTLMREALVAHPEFRYENVLPYALGTPYSKKLTGDHPVLDERKANGTMCHMIMLTRGTPLHMAHSCQPGSSSVVALVRGAEGEYSAATLEKARGDVLRALYKHSQVDVVVINSYLGKPVMLQYTVTVARSTPAAAIVHGSVLLAPGVTFCFSAALGYNITATSDYRYTSPEIAEATRGMTNAENRRHVEGEGGAMSNAAELRSQELNSGEIHSLEGKYNMGKLPRPAFEGLPLQTELIVHAASVYLPYYKYDAHGRPDLARGLQRAQQSTFGLQGQEQIDSHAEAVRMREELVLDRNETEVNIYRAMMQGVTQVRNVRRTFSRLGFGVGHLPNDIFLVVYTFWYNAHKNRQLENWSWNDIITNSRDQPSHMYYLPCNLRDRFSDALLVLVSGWVNSEVRAAHLTREQKEGAKTQGTPLQPVALETTSLYGIREYSHGARLVQHVDKVNTHACSVIVQVGQAGMLEPWPLEIYDHAGRLHEVSMAQGDILYYESAKNIHSRVRPMLGSQFANIFAHYRPLRRDPETGELRNGDGLWYEQENVPGTVKAITMEDVAAATAAAAAAATATAEEGEGKGGGGASNGFDAADSSAARSEPEGEKGKEQYATMFLSEEETTLLQPYKGEDGSEARDTLYNFWSRHNCEGSCAGYMPHYARSENRVH